ncbi:chorismate mutase [Saccharibacter sp. 17.LH.SD]|uniref:chorismate mutase n=1 Tax=Saccharibacter sp. 17.LH.SD TaxID=2689393 RepID=UPI00136F5358|nr:chorismate mutase [Saccharibacter sp. 17.LH.SD]MXV44513.1 chorismate mutase [Saccharibacter sp. 17.LH.SD]
MTSEISTLSPALREQLQELRSSIDNIDAALICMLAERFRCTQRVGELKAQYGLPPVDAKREEKQRKRLRSLAQTTGLDPEFSERFFAFVVKEVIENHKAIAQAYESRNKKQS